MTIARAKMILKEELDHTEQHLQFKDKSPEYYKELQDIADALKIALKCMEVNLISAKDFKKRINNMEYIYLQDCAEDVLDAIDCEVTYFKEKMKGGAE